MTKVVLVASLVGLSAWALLVGQNVIGYALTGLAAVVLLRWPNPNDRGR